MAKKNTEVTGWVGWVGFASFMLMLGGFFSVVSGFVAMFKHTAVFTGTGIYLLDHTQWGLVHLLVGLLAMLAASSLARGGAYGRIVAVLVALSSAVLHLAFMPIYPFWSAAIIVVDVLVIFAVTVHGKEVENLN